MPQPLSVSLGLSLNHLSSLRLIAPLLGFSVPHWASSTVCLIEPACASLCLSLHLLPHWVSVCLFWVSLYLIEAPCASLGLLGLSVSLCLNHSVPHWAPLCLTWPLCPLLGLSVPHWASPCLIGFLPASLGLFWPFLDVSVPHWASSTLCASLRLSVPY